jgi:hypothetical protein
MSAFVAAGDNYWQVIDDRPPTDHTPDLGDYYETSAKARENYDKLPGPGRLMATHDDGVSDQFDWQLVASKP